MNEEALLGKIAGHISANEEITLLIGSGVTAPGAWHTAYLLGLAEQYADVVGDNGDLARSLERVRAAHPETAAPRELYLAYRDVFTDWVSEAGFDVVAQQAVLDAFRPPEWAESPLGTHGIFQRLDLKLGERTENALADWVLPPGVEAIGRLLARMPDDFGDRILTTAVDPLLALAVRRADARALAVAVQDDGQLTRSGGEGAVRVYHLHGYWRPLPDQHGMGLLAEPGTLREPDEAAVAAVADLISGDRLCVVGYSGWDELVLRAIRRAAQRHGVEVLWAQHDPGSPIGQRERTRVTAELAGLTVRFYDGVDADTFFPALVERLDITAAPRRTDRRFRHIGWERDFVSQPHNQPPQDVTPLLRQLERRFNWQVDWAGPEHRPRVLFWPIRLREQTSLIHAVQALAAGALSQRGIRVVICLDDFGDELAQRYRGEFRNQLLRWMRSVHPDADPEFVYLQDFIDSSARHPAGGAALRPTDPWSLASAFYSGHNPSLYSVLAAIKVIPNVPLHDLEEHAVKIVKALLSKDSYRLLTPVTLWTLLQNIIGDEPSDRVMTLGGRDEGLLWKLWQESFGLGVNQLYNPHIRGLTNESGMVRWASKDHLLGHLRGQHGATGWDDVGGYIPWLFQNALLLPRYLTQQPPPRLDGLSLDSWAAFRAALDDGLPALDLLAERVSEFYLGTDR